MDDATRQTILESALGLLGLPTIERQQGGVEVVATVLADREPDEAMRVSIGRVLAERARADLPANASGVVDARVDSSDESDCEDLEGRTGNAFVRGERCYRLILMAVST